MGLWTDLPPWSRLLISLIVTALGILIVVKSVHMGAAPGMIVDDPSRWFLLVGFAITGIGVGLLAVSGKSDSEKNGYKF
jgi:hypothetical protein